MMQKWRPLVRSILSTNAHKSVLNPSHSYVANRAIFSDSYLGIDYFSKQRNKAKLLVLDHDSFKGKIKASFDESGLRNIFVEDLEHMMDIADGDDDLRLLSDILRSSLQVP